DPEAGEVFLGLHERPVGEHFLAVAVVDHGGRVLRAESAGEDPVTIRLESLVEDVDRSHLGVVSETGTLGDHGKQIMHLELLLGLGRACRPFTPTTYGPPSIRQHSRNLAAQLSSAQRAGVPSDHCCTGIANPVRWLTVSSIPSTGDPGRFAPQLAGSKFE